MGPFATVTATVNAGCTGYGCSQGVTSVSVGAHVILGGSRIATVRASDVLYYHRDQQGSVVATTVTGGQVGVRYRYTPYGELDRVDVGSSSEAARGSELGYTGGLRLGWNPATGARAGNLLLLGARVYDASWKRWLQPDTVDLTRYSYAGGDPRNFVDPSGRMPVQDAVADRVGGGAWTTVLWEGLFYIQVPYDSPLQNFFAMSAYHAWIMQKYGPAAYARVVDAEYAAQAAAIAEAEKKQAQEARNRLARVLEKGLEPITDAADRTSAELAAGVAAMSGGEVVAMAGQAVTTLDPLVQGLLKGEEVPAFLLGKMMDYTIWEAAAVACATRWCAKGQVDVDTNYTVSTCHHIFDRFSLPDATLLGPHVFTCASRCSAMTRTTDFRRACGNAP